MQHKNSNDTGVDEYIASFPEDVQDILKKIREIILEVAPAAAESIAYRMPAYKMNGRPLVYFAGFKSHIGLYALPSGHAAFAHELSAYRQGRGSVQFPLNRPIPYDLIRQIVAYRVEENLLLEK